MVSVSHIVVDSHSEDTPVHSSAAPGSAVPGSAASGSTQPASLLDLLRPLCQKHATGQLALSLSGGGENATQWRIFIYLGQLVWVEDSVHRHRRWQRAIHKYCPELLTTVKPDYSQDGWEVATLVKAVGGNQLSPLQAQQILFKIAQECLFPIIDQTNLQAQWIPEYRVGNLGHFAAFLPLDDLLKSVHRQRAQWKQVAEGHLQVLLNKFSPDMAPTVRNSEQLETLVSPSLYQLLSRLMQGRLTLWDVAEHIQKPMPSVMRSLLPLLRQGVLSFRVVGDIVPQSALTVSARSSDPRKRKPLIACIDDSTLVLNQMEQILQGYGCDVIGLDDPISGLGVLLDRKPDLIFLDLIMPTTNGYELGQFLKKTTTFHKTPVVILTSRDRVGDRMRAKQIGTAGFLTKPADPDKVLGMLHRLLPDYLLPHLMDLPEEANLG
jgi:two-component system, chemotaxis family, response regulator PixG